MFVDQEKIFDETIFSMYGGVGNLVLVILIWVITTEICVHLLIRQFETARSEMPMTSTKAETTVTDNITTGR